MVAALGAIALEDFGKQPVCASAGHGRAVAAVHTAAVSTALAPVGLGSLDEALLERVVVLVPSSNTEFIAKDEVGYGEARKLELGRCWEGCG